MLTKNSIKRPFTVIVMLVVIAIIGGVAVTQMPLDLFPEMELPYMIVATMVPGASAEVVEKTVTDKMEANMRQINNVTNVQSISADSVSAVIMALKNGTDLTKMRVDIQESIKPIRASFPEMAMDPVVMDVDPDMMPIMTLTISKYGQTIEQSSEALREISSKIKSVGGVASITTTGDISDNVFMQIDPEKLLKNPESLLVNHLKAYLNNPMKTMPEKLSRMLDPNDKEHYNFMLATLVTTIKTSSTDDIVALLDNYGVSMDLSGMIGDNKDAFLGSFSQMLTPEMISMMIVGNDFEMPAGSTQVSGSSLIVKVGQKLDRFNDLKHLPAFSLDLREMKLDDNSPSVINLLQPLLAGVGTPDTLTDELVAEHVKKMIGTGPVEPSVAASQEEKDAYILAKAAYDKQVKNISSTLRKGGIVPVNATISEINNFVGDIVGDLPADATPEQIEAYNKKFNTIQNVVCNILYNTEDNINYTRDDEVFNYVMGLLYQPLTVELQDFAYMYRTNTAASAHTIVNGADGMLLSVFKTPDSSVTQVTNGILDLVKEIQAEDESIQCIVLSNQGEVTKFMISSIAQNLLLGALFAVLVLLVFLRDWKPTVTVGMSILVSLVTAFAVMYLCGVTLNLVSMGGLALSVGMLVDNSIVVIENIYRKRNEGVSAIKAAYEGTKQVAGAIMSSTITTVIVFLPIIFVDGITKQIFTDLAITIAVSLFASLLVAITFVPMISSRMVNLNKAARHETKSFVKFKTAYAKALNFMLNKKWITVTVVTVLFIASIVSAFFMNVEFLPSTQMEQIVVSTGIYKDKLPADYSYDEIVDDVIKDIDRELDNLTYVDNKGIEMSGGMKVMGFTMGGGNIMTYVTIDKKSRVKPDEAIEDMKGVIEKIANDPKYPQGVIKPGGIKDAGGVDIESMVNNYLDASVLTINLYGKDIEHMTEAAGVLKKKLEDKMGGEKDETLMVKGLMSPSKEFKLRVDTNKASKYNLTTAQIFLQYFTKTVPDTANTDINFTTDGENDIYIYTLANNMERWYRAYERDANGNVVGKAHRMYFNKGDDTDNANIFTERIKNTDGTIEEKKFTLTITNGVAEFEEINGTTKYTVNANDMPVYTDNTKLNEADMITLDIDVPKFGEMPDMDDNSIMPMASEQNGDLNQKKTVPIFMLLDPVSFKRDNINNDIVYRKADDPLFAGTVDNKRYYKDKDGYIRYNYTGEEIGAIDQENDVNPRVPLGIKEVDGLNTINHVEGRRVVQLTVQSDKLSNKVLEKEAREVIKEFNNNVDKYNADITNDVKVTLNAEFVGANEVITDTFNGLFLMVGLAIVFIYLVMVAQFQSLKSPFIIMFTIPLALTGSILTLLMAGMPISVFALTGIILLVGIVVNNGIVFVDYVNKLREAGMPKREALLKSAQDRIRPILMTALTTICSMLISVFDTSMGAAAIKPMAVTVVGGLTYATLLTLFFVPILYDAFNRKEKVSVIKFDDDKEEDIEAEMRLSKISTVKEVLEESKTLQMMDEGFIANNLPTETPMETYISETTGEEAFKEEVTADTSEDTHLDNVDSSDNSPESTEDVKADVKATDVVEDDDKSFDDKTE